MITTITLLMVLAVGSGAAFVRGQVLEQEIAGEMSARAHAMKRFDQALPGTVKPEAVDADARAVQQEVDIKRRGGWGTLVILGIIFFFLQILSMFFGYRHSFNGRLSKEAYRALRADRFSSYNELTQYYDRVADIAQGKVERLQQLLEQKNREGVATVVDTVPYTFRDYLQARDVLRRDKPLGAEPDAPVAHPVAAPVATPVPTATRTRTRARARANGKSAAIHAPAPAKVVEEPQVPIFGSIPLVPNGASGADSPSESEMLKARLDLAERLEREKAASRALHGKSNGKGTGDAPTNLEDGGDR